MIIAMNERATSAMPVPIAFDTSVMISVSVMRPCYWVSLKKTGEKKETSSATGSVKVERYGKVYFFG